MSAVARLTSMGEPQGNRVITGGKSLQADPKPGELAPDRLKAG